ncbi:two-component sensor histidine kinase [Phytohabitans suffuscus]|uniref:histidine kinase n=1 Tax=Phytohabitans suffuscus TaxID=624315 RepID=A0A6F8YM81_9ACTN|nr:two-component sensor histidine kinase [Phytohabitans suffuscus]
MTQWIGRLFDERAWPARLTLLFVLTVGYLVLLRAPASPPTLADWVLALAAVALSAGGGRWPLATAFAQSGLLMVAYEVSNHAAVVVKIAAGVALFELAMRRSGWQVLVGTLAPTAVYVLHPSGGVPALLYRAAVLVGAPVLIGAYIRSVRQAAAQAQQRVAEEQRRRLSETRAARANERTAIARELHDVVAHHVASIVLRVGVARHVLPADDPRVREVLDDVHGSGTATLSALRRLVTVLREPEVGDTPPFVEPGELHAALDEVVQRGRQVGLDIDSSVDPAVGGLDPVRGLAVLRLTQEGLTNVAKHAGTAARAEVSMRLTPDDAVLLEIVDDGGTSPPALPSDGAMPGHGLIGMRERVELLGGSLSVGREGRGWRLSALLPSAAPPMGLPVTKTCRLHPHTPAEVHP